MKKLIEMYNGLSKEQQEKIDKVVIPIIKGYYYTVIFTLQLIVTLVSGIVGAIIDYDYPVSGFILGTIIGLGVTCYIISKNEWL